MKSPNYKVEIGIIGLGAIGSRMAKTINADFRKDCRITGLCDVDTEKTQKLIKNLKLKKSVGGDLKDVIKRSDCIIEAVNTPATEQIIRKAIKAKKTVLAMSVGRVLNHQDLFQLARKNKCYIMLPSGAIAGIDAIKAASLKHLKYITLTTRKPIAGWGDNPYFAKKGIDLKNIKGEKIIFEGSVDDAIKYFPQNINVAATIALACQDKQKLKVKLMTSPKYKLNSHEIEFEGDFGHSITKTENVCCPDNPKTSYLAVLSGLQTLKQYCKGILVGT